MTHLLLPEPAQLRRTGGVLCLDDSVSYFSGDTAGAPVLEQRIHAYLDELGIAATATDDRSRAQLHLAVSRAGAPESYRLVIAADGIAIDGADDAGLFYAVATLGQWLRTESRRTTDGVEVSRVEIDDRPGFPVRGVMLDISRNKVPTMATLRELIDLLADWKINHLQLYLEHTFAYRGHQAVWQGWSPITPVELVELDRFARQRFVELVPNQNSFGHLHHWLTHEPYRQLAECPDGIRHPFSEEVEPFSLCPTDPRSLELLADLYDQLLPCFRSRLFNVGLDETFDLGQGRSAEACAERGKGRVYLEYLQRVHQLVSERDHRMLFWGDIILEHPDLVGELPPDVVALEWGYEADHPFAEHGRSFAQSGVDFWVCGGTSSWLSLAGRTTNALGNLSAAARSGTEHGASGYLVTDWGDWGHLQPLPVSYLGFAAGAHFAWRPESAAADTNSGESKSSEDSARYVDRNWTAILDAHAFRDSAGVLGSCYYHLGEIYGLAGAVPVNSSSLFNLLFRGEDLSHRRFDGLSVAALETSRAAIDRATDRLPEAASQRSDTALLVAEAQWVAAMMRLAAEIGIARLEGGKPIGLDATDPKARRQWALRLEALREERRRLWLERHRPGGLDVSLRRLDRLMADLRS